MAYPSGWDGYFDITVDSEYADSESARELGFDLSRAPAGFWSNVDSAGDEIGVWGPNEERLPCTVSGWDYAGQKGWLFFSVEDFEFASDTSFRIYAGKAGETAYLPTTVWQAGTFSGKTGAYRGVWHLEEDPSGGAPQIVDALGVSAGTSYGSMTSGDLVDGKVRKCLDFDGSDDYINLGSNAGLLLATFTAMAFIKTGTSGADAQIINATDYGTPYVWSLRVLASGYAGFSRCRNSSGDNFVFLEGVTTSVVNNAWHHLAGVSRYSQRTMTVSGAGTSGVNGTYYQVDSTNWYKDGDTTYRLQKPGANWELSKTGALPWEIPYYMAGAGDDPPDYGWTTTFGSPPTPTVSGPTGQAAGGYLYVDGSLEDSDTTTGEPNMDSCAVCLGSRSTGEQKFTGLIDEVRYHEAAMSAGEVNLVYNYLANNATVIPTVGSWSVDRTGEFTRWSPLGVPGRRYQGSLLDRSSLRALRRRDGNKGHLLVPESEWVW